MSAALEERIARAIVCARYGRAGADHEFTVADMPVWRMAIPEAKAAISAVEDAGMVIVPAHEPYAAWLERRKAPGPGEAT